MPRAAAALATAHVERVDRVINDLAQRMDHTLRIVPGILNSPGREARAILAALTAALRAVRARPRHGRSEDEDALFI